MENIYITRERKEHLTVEKYIEKLLVEWRIEEGCCKLAILSFHIIGWSLHTSVSLQHIYLLLHL
jgi:hypothetical protein